MGTDAKALELAGRHCRGCGYELRGLGREVGLCPECGREFVAGDLTTTKGRPGERWGEAKRKLIYWGKRALVVGAGLGVLYLLMVGWVAWGWWREQAAVKRMGELGGQVWYGQEEPTLATTLLPGRLRFLRMRVRGILVERAQVPRPACDDDMVLVARCSRLQILQINTPVVTDAGVAHLAGLEQLKHLSLAGDRITDASADHLLRLGGLSSLELWEVGLGDRGLATLARHPTLANLDATAPISDAGAMSLRGMVSLTQVTLLADVSDRGLEALVSKPGMQSVFVDSPLCSREAVERLRRENPQCRVRVVGR